MEKTHRLRVLIVAVLSMLVFGGILVRLYHLQVYRHEFYVKKALAQQMKTVTLNQRRGDILDRTGQILATSTIYDTVYYNPAYLKEGETLPAELPERVARVLRLPEIKVAEIFKKTKRTLIARKIPPEYADGLRLLEDDLDLPANLISFDKESKRLYSQGDLAGPIIGYTKIDDHGDNIGQEGLELSYNEVLSGKVRKVKVPVNSWRQGLAPMDESAIKATYGNSVVLTLDSQIQLYAQKALRRKVGEVQAEGGGAIVMDVQTGAILAMASCPDFDPNFFSRAKSEQRRNRCLTDPFEIGSVMKILTSAILIEKGRLKADELVDCMGGRGYVDGRHFKDAHPLGVVPFRAAFAESSNIALARLGLRLEPREYYDALRLFGLGSRLGVDLRGESGGVLRPVEKWTRLSRTSLPVGYETSMTGLQVVTAISSIANGGTLMKPRLMERVISPEGKLVQDNPPLPMNRVASAETCATMIELMRAVVDEGTGGSAKVTGYSVAGKTGTTRKVMEGRHYIASFAGVIPAQNPRLCIYVFVEEPDYKIQFYGGHVAAPVFQEIAENAVRILGIPPDMPAELEIAAQTLPKSTSLSPALHTLPVREENVDGMIDAEEEITAKTAALAGRELALAVKMAANADGATTGTVAATPVSGTPDSNASVASADEPSISEVPKPTPVPLDTSAKREMVMQRVAAEKAARENIEPGVMPLCVGLSITEVLELAAKAEIKVEIEGSGLAIAQVPAPGARVESKDKAKITFSLPSQRLKKHAPDPAVVAEQGA